MAHGIPLIVDSAKRDLNSVIEWGRQKMADGAYEVAVQHFTSALDLKPGLMHALVSRGFCHLTLGNEEKAQKDFAEVITKDAGFNRNIYVLIALCFKRSGEYHKAIRYLTRCIGQFSSFKPALIARGELSLKVREYEKARVDFWQVLNSSPTDLVARRGLGDALRGLGNFREALRQYSRAIEDATQLLAHCREEEKQRAEESWAPAAAREEAADRAGSEGLGEVSGLSSGNGSIVEVDRDSGNSTGCAAASGGGAHSSAAGGPWREASEASPDTGPDSLVLRDELGSDPIRLQGFLADSLLRRALLLRLLGELDAAGESLLEVLELDIQDGLALFWYAKLLLEQGRHKEATGFLQASIQHHPETRVHAHALLGALLMSWPEPDCEGALRHLREAMRIEPSSQQVRVTLWIVTAAALLRQAPRDPQGALVHLDRAVAALSAALPAGAGPAGATAAGGGGPGAHASPRNGQTPRVHVAGSGVAAAAALALTTAGKSPEETRWSAARALVRRRQELAQGGDLELALECRTYFQLVAEEPCHKTAEVPFLLYVLRTVALCDLCRWDEAVADCRRALAIDPKDETAQYTLHIANGILRSKCGEFEPAVTSFAKAVRIRPVSMEARVHRAIALARAARAQNLSGSGAGAGGRDTSGRAANLLEQAAQDLEAVEQQAQITGSVAPLGAAHLRAACLCSLGLPQEAHQVLQQCRERGEGDAEALARQTALEAEVLILLGQYADAIEACTAMLTASPAVHGHVEARLMRGCCWSELGEEERAFEDYREALVLAPDRADVHEASGELFALHRCFGEAITAFNTAAKLSDSLSSRITYKRALAYLSLGNANAALKDIGRALRLNPNMPVVSRARDGVAALQTAIEGDFRHAHVRFNMLLHAPVPASAAADRLPALMLPHEIVLYRGVCSMYIGDAAAAIQDFGTAVELAQQVMFSEQARREEKGKGLPGAQSSPADVHRRLRLPPEVASQKGLDCFACEAQYNIALCLLMGHQYRTALDTCQKLLECQEPLKELGAQALCLVWFLIGVCNLALGEVGDKVAREAFTQSYAHDPMYVDDFLRRHGRRHEPAVSMGPGVSPVEPPTRGAPVPPISARGRVGAPFRPLGGAPTPPPGVRSGAPAAAGVCDAAPEAVCCLRAAERARLSAKLPPYRLQVRDIVIWVRPSASWPCVRPPRPAPPASLARLDLLQQHETLNSLHGCRH